MYCPLPSNLAVGDTCLPFIRMQFNPACLSSSSANSTPNTSPSPASANEYMSNPATYSDGPPPQNSWPSSSVLGVPVYGIYNASLIPVPEASPNQASDTAQKKKSVKRPTQVQKPAGDGSVMEESTVPKTEDKFQGLDEEQKIKRQRRLIKNREAAQQFRQRQKEYIQNLERRVTELNTHVGETHKHIELLTAENRLLRDQLVYLYNVMRQNLSLTSTPSPSFSTTSLATSVPQSPSITPNPTPPTSPCSTFPAGLLPATSTTLASAPQMIDLTMMGFKGYNVMDGTVSLDLYKANAQQVLSHNLAQNMSHTSQNLVQSIHPSITQNIAQNLSQLSHNQMQTMSQMLASPHTPPGPSPAPSPPSTPSSLPDLSSMKLDIENTVFSRFKSSDPNEAQTVPVFVKNEGGAASL